MKRLANSGSLALVVGLLGGFVLAPGTARALQCATNFVSVPEAEQSNVPTDTLLWGYARNQTRLLGPSGNVVATDERKLPIAAWSGVPGIFPVLVPREPLEPNASYTIEIDDRGDSAPPQHIVFTTGAGPAGMAPELPVLLSSESVANLSYYEGSIDRFVSLRFEFEGILIGDTGQLGDIATIDALFEQGDANLVGPFGGAEGRFDEDLPMIQWVSRNESMSAGISPCGVWPPGASDYALGRFGVLDLAGNFSGWASVPLELPSLAEAEAAAQEQAAAELEVRRTLNVQQGRPSACSLGLPGVNDPAPTERRRIEWLALAVGLVAAGARRARRHGAGAMAS
jgi:hypothetical protein